MDHLFVRGECYYCGAPEEGAPAICLDEQPRRISDAVRNATKLALIEHDYSHSDVPMPQLLDTVAATLVQRWRALARDHELTLLRVTKRDGGQEVYRALLIASYDSVGYSVQNVLDALGKGNHTLSVTVEQCVDDYELLTFETLWDLRKTLALRTPHGAQDTARRIVERVTYWRQYGRL